MKLKPSEAKRIIIDIAFDESRINNEECEALRCGVQALSIIDNLKNDIKELDKDHDGIININEVFSLIDGKLN